MQDPDKERRREFEDRLASVIGPIFSRYLLATRQAVLDDKSPPGRRFSQNDFEFSFDRHYRLVQDYFRNRVFNPYDPVENNRNAKEYFETKISDWRISTAGEIASLTAETNQVQAERAIEEAERTLRSAGSFSKFELAVTSAAILSRLFQSRIPLIAETETLAASESTKDLKGDAIANTSLSEIYVVTKTWNSLLDGRERPSHASASGQQRSSGSPFSVGGSSLRYPGDPRAPARERCRCRCFLTSSITRIE